MKKLILSVVALICVVGIAQAKSKNPWPSYGTGSNPDSVDVRGHYRTDGTYVDPYRRTKPNDTTSDNYDTSGNFNPWTGKTGKEKKFDLDEERALGRG